MRKAWSRLVIVVGLLAAGCANSPTEEQTADASAVRSDSATGDGSVQGPDGSVGDGSTPTDSTLAQDTSSSLDTGVTPPVDTSAPPEDSGIVTDSATTTDGEATDSGVRADSSENESGSLGGDGGARDGETLPDTGEGSDTGLVRDAAGPADAGSTDTGTEEDARELDGTTGADGMTGVDGAPGTDTGTLTDSGTPLDGSSLDASHPMDSSAAEAGDASDGSTCIVVTSDQEPFDGGTCPAPTNNSCNPASVSSFNPTYRPPTGAHQALCTTSMINQIYADCFGNGTGSCSDDETNFAACFACIFTDESSSSWGPLVTVSNHNGDIAQVNIAGCVALLEPCNVPCAQAYEYAFQCETQACGNNCVNSSQTRYEDCTTTADNCGCQSYFDPAQCVANISGSTHPAATCTTQSSFEGYFDVIVPLFCGM